MFVPAITTSVVLVAFSIFIVYVAVAVLCVFVSVAVIATVYSPAGVPGAIVIVAPVMLIYSLPDTV